MELLYSRSRPLATLNKPMEPTRWRIARPFSLRRRIAQNRFQFEKFFEPGLTPFSTVARLLEASKTTPEVHPCTINVNIA